jgi:lipid-binding SYLF domain-containing protein
MMRKTISSVFLAAATALTALATDEPASRFERAASVFQAMMKEIKPGQLAGADCVVIVPRFKKGAAGVGVGFGKGFISCRNPQGEWSAPGGITLETASVGVQLGGEEMDIVALSLDKNQRAKLLSDQFALGADAAAAWGNGKVAHEDTNAKIVFYGRSKGAFAGFGLDGATLKPDDSSNKALYGKSISNGEIVAESEIPPAAQPFITKLTQASR